MRPNGDGRSPLELARERHRPFLQSIEAAPPPDVRDANWQAAIDGLWVFLAAGHADEALRLGWPPNELFRVPERWSQIHLCGVGLLIGDHEVVEIRADAIRIETRSGAAQSFYRKPAPDYAVAYRERLRLAGEDARKEEVQLRALEHTINLCRAHTGVGVDTAKVKVLAAIERSSSSPGAPAR
jgi:hypothetical protein